jgi:hypothetical protein
MTHQAESTSCSHVVPDDCCMIIYHVCTYHVCTDIPHTHREVLLRARAIECQAYVVAAAQAGKHNEKRESYGHALIVDPWGEVVARLDDPLATGEGFRARADSCLPVDLDGPGLCRVPLCMHNHARHVSCGTQGCTCCWSSLTQVPPSHIFSTASSVHAVIRIDKYPLLSHAVVGRYCSSRHQP